MKKKLTQILLGCTLLLAACNSSEDASTSDTASSTTVDTTRTVTNSNATDAVSVAPGLYTVIKDSAGIRVLDINYKPGDSSAMHTHPDNVLYVVESSKSEFTTQQGQKEIIELPSGFAMIGSSATHSVKNIGTSSTRAILVEVNRSNNAGMPADAALDALKVNPRMHQLVKDTLNIRAFIFTAKPGESTGKHAHPDHVVYIVQGGKAEFTAADGTKQQRELSNGVVLNNPATVHTFKNVGNTTIKAFVVEVNRAAQ